MMGKPVIRHTRVTVELILGKLRRGVTAEQLLEDYPHLTIDDILAAQSYAQVNSLHRADSGSIRDRKTTQWEK